MPPQDTDAPQVERAIVEAFLGRERSMALPELYAVVRATPTDVDRATDVLLGAGVLRQAPHGKLAASRALEHLYTLGMIAV